MAIKTWSFYWSYQLLLLSFIIELPIVFRYFFVHTGNLISVYILEQHLRSKMIEMSFGYRMAVVFWYSTSNFCHRHDVLVLELSIENILFLSLLCKKGYIIKLLEYIQWNTVKETLYFVFLKYHLMNKMYRKHVWVLMLLKDSAIYWR